jgi:hypothetical protein
MPSCSLLHRASPLRHALPLATRCPHRVAFVTSPSSRVAPHRHALPFVASPSPRRPVGRPIATRRPHHTSPSPSPSPSSRRPRHASPPIATCRPSSHLLRRVALSVAPSPRVSLAVAVAAALVVLSGRGDFCFLDQTRRGKPPKPDNDSDERGEFGMGSMDKESSFKLLDVYSAVSM